MMRWCLWYQYPRKAEFGIQPLLISSHEREKCPLWKARIHNHLHTRPLRSPPFAHLPTWRLITSRRVAGVGETRSSQERPSSVHLLENQYVIEKNGSFKTRKQKSKRWASSTVEGEQSLRSPLFGWFVVALMNPCLLLERVKTEGQREEGKWKTSQTFAFFVWYSWNLNRVVIFDKGIPRRHLKAKLKKQQLY